MPSTPDCEVEVDEPVKPNTTLNEDWGDSYDEKTGEPIFKYEVENSPAQGTQEWLDWRKGGITATEAAAIMFPDKYGSPLGVYSKKLGLVPDDQSDPDGFFEWGHIIEDDIVKKFQKNHPEVKSMTQGRLYSRGWCLCSLDAQCIDGEGDPMIVECKTSQSLSKWNPYPDRYYAQVQWQMYVTGIRKAVIAALVAEGGWHYIEREIEYSREFVIRMIVKCRDVYNCINRKTPPQVTLSSVGPDKQAIAAIRGDSDEYDKPCEVTRETIAEYERLKKAAEDATAAFEAFKNRMGMDMLNSKRATCEGKTFCSWVERKGSTSIDANKLKELYPEAYETCKKEGLPSRYLRYSVPTFENK